MLSPLVIVAVGLSLGVLAETESACGSAGKVSTITITETVSPVTVTVNIATAPFSISLDSGLPSVNTVVPTESSIDITSTLTSYSTLTNVVSLIEATSFPVKSEKGPYSFAEHSGTTSWLGGKTPPSTASFVVKTSAVTVMPVPDGSIIPSGTAPDSETFSTLTLTSTTSKIFTKTLTESFSTPEPSAKPFTGLAPHGWNSSTTFLTVKVGPTAHVPVPIVHPTAYSTGEITQRWDVPEPWINGVPQWPDAAMPITRVEVASEIAVRQVGAVIFATIGGQVVSWTNSYNGGVSEPATSEVVPSSSVPPTVTLGAYPWNLPVPPSPVPATSSATPTTVVGAYPWNLPSVPQSSSTATSAPSTPLSQSSWELQPGVPTMQPSMDLSYMSSVLQISSTHSSAIVSITPSSSSQLASTSTSVVSLISLIPGPTASANATTSTGTASAPHPSCSDKSPFIIGFDDLPHFSIANNPNDTDIPPIFNPYRKLYWESHFGYVPPPTDPFPPISGQQLAVYRVDDNTDVDASPDSGLELTGEFGSGPRASDNAYWIDAYSVYLGCSNAGPSDCIITLNGYETASSTRVASQTVTQAPCPGLTNCKLAKVSFNEEFRNLSGIQIIAAVDRRPITWYMDELELGWSNNTCEATTKRNSHQ